MPKKTIKASARPILTSAPVQVWVPALIFTSVLIFFLMAVFFLNPVMTPDQGRIILLLFALLAGFSTFFLGGTALLEISQAISKGSKFGLSATAGVAVFMLCYLYPPHFIHPLPPPLKPTPLSAEETKIVGVWLLEKLVDTRNGANPARETEEARMGTRMELTDDGRVLMTLPAKSVSHPYEGIYKLNGNKLTMTVAFPGRSPTPEVDTVTALTGNKLITFSSKGQIGEWTKMAK